MRRAQPCVPSPWPEEEAQLASSQGEEAAQCAKLTAQLHMLIRDEYTRWPSEHGLEHSPAGPGARELPVGDRSGACALACSSLPESPGGEVPAHTSPDTPSVSASLAPRRSTASVRTPRNVGGVGAAAMVLVAPRQPAGGVSGQGGRADIRWVLISGVEASLEAGGGPSGCVRGIACMLGAIADTAGGGATGEF
eukprot:scaffold89477_cov27-Tisochrysis_lutea.AAC.3